jgi:hypothetical protein
MKKCLFIVLLVGLCYAQPKGSVYFKIGSGSTNNKITNLEYSGDSEPNYEAEGVIEGYAEIGYKRSVSDQLRLRAYIGSYAGNDQDALGAEYGISSYGFGLEIDFPEFPNLYFTGDLFQNFEFIDYSDMRVASSGEVYTYYQDPTSVAFGLGYKINNNISIEVKYKNHNSLHYSEFPSGTLFWWSFDYSRSGVYGLLNLQLDI